MSLTAVTQNEQKVIDSVPWKLRIGGVSEDGQNGTLDDSAIGQALTHGSDGSAHAGLLRFRVSGDVLCRTFDKIVARADELAL